MKLKIYLLLFFVGTINSAEEKRIEEIRRQSREKIQHLESQLNKRDCFSFCASMGGLLFTFGLGVVVGGTISRAEFNDKLTKYQEALNTYNERLNNVKLNIAEHKKTKDDLLICEQQLKVKEDQLNINLDVYRQEQREIFKEFERIYKDHSNKCDLIREFEN